VKSATTGGRATAEEQREKGGRADECPVYELYAYLLAGDDDEFAKEVYDECVGGERLCGGCKEQAAELMEAFLEDHQEKRAEWEAKIDEPGYRPRLRPEAPVILWAGLSRLLKLPR